MRCLLPAETPAIWNNETLLTLPWLIHGVTERPGGVSDPPFASLNLGLHVGDTISRVVENRARVAARAGLSLERMVCAEQIHGSRVQIIGEEHAGLGAEALDTAVPGTDALITAQSNLLLTLFFADCLPILLADPEKRVAAVAHAGWRGLVGGVIENTVQVMTQQFGTRPQSVIAAIGPGIGPCCFEVGDEVAAHFPASLVLRSRNGNKPRVDLPGAARYRLQAAGVPSTQSEASGLCTACSTDRFFSHRAENGQTGRMAAFVAIRL